MKKEKEKKMKDKLEKKLKRPATPKELINMETDTQLSLEVLQDQVDDLEARVKKLEK